MRPPLPVPSYLMESQRPECRRNARPPTERVLFALPLELPDAMRCCTSVAVIDARLQCFLQSKYVCCFDEVLDQRGHRITITSLARQTTWLIIQSAHKAVFAFAERAHQSNVESGSCRLWRSASPAAMATAWLPSALQWLARACCVSQGGSRARCTGGYNALQGSKKPGQGVSFLLCCSPHKLITCMHSCLTCSSTVRSVLQSYA